MIQGPYLTLDTNIKCLNQLKNSGKSHCGKSVKKCSLCLRIYYCAKCRGVCIFAVGIEDFAENLSCKMYDKKYYRTELDLIRRIKLYSRPQQNNKNNKQEGEGEEINDNLEQDNDYSTAASDDSNQNESKKTVIEKEKQEKYENIEFFVPLRQDDRNILNDYYDLDQYNRDIVLEYHLGNQEKIKMALVENCCRARRYTSVTKNEITHQYKHRIGPNQERKISRKQKMQEFELLYIKDTSIYN